MEIAIVTLDGYWNYGNRLQNFALKRVLENMDAVSVTTIRTWQGDRKYGLPKTPRGIISAFRHNKWSEIRAMRKRVAKFHQFSTYYLNESEFVVPVDNYAHYLNKYEKVILGSDQIWNPMWLTIEQLKFFLLTEVSSRRKFSYAASIGIEELPDPYKSVMSEYIEKFEYVSVRESKAADIIQNITEGRVRPEIVLDPTMLLSKTEWIDALNIEVEGHDDYIFTYFLGDQSSETMNALNVLKKRYKHVVSFHDTSRDQLRYFDSGPEAFVSKIANAGVIVTDSFHAAVFANVFNKPVIIANRPDLDMSSRLVSLYENLGTQMYSVAQIKTLSDFDEIVWPDTFPALSEKIQESLSYLERALKS